MIGVEYQNNTSIKQTFHNLDNTDENVAVKSSVLRMGVYLQDELRITDTLSATLGLRYDHNKWIGSRLSPRAALIWQANPKTTFKARYGRVHRSKVGLMDTEESKIVKIEHQTNATPALNSERLDQIFSLDTA